MGPTLSTTLAVGRAVWRSARRASNAEPGQWRGDKAHVGNRPESSRSVENNPRRASCNNVTTIEDFTTKFDEGTEREVLSVITGIRTAYIYNVACTRCLK